MPRTQRELLSQSGQKIGLVCRGCGCQHFRVIYTRRAAQERMVRRRECRNCGRRLTTHERPI